MIEKEKYEEYRKSLLNIAILTNKENSVLINFNINGDTCTNVVSFIQQNGTKDILEDSTFVCDDEFYKDFLEKLIIDYYSNMVIAFNDSIDMNADGKYTYRIITDDNDMLSIDGISLDYANYLLNLSKKKDDVTSVTEVNENGVATAIITAVLLGGIGAVLLIMFSLLN